MSSFMLYEVQTVKCNGTLFLLIYLWRQNNYKHNNILVSYEIVFVRIPIDREKQIDQRIDFKVGIKRQVKVYMCENFISTPRALKLSINLLRDCQNHVSERSLLIIPVTFNDGSTNGPFICSIIGDTIPSRDQQLQDWLLFYIKVKWVLLVCLIDSVQ